MVEGIFFIGIVRYRTEKAYYTVIDMVWHSTMHIPILAYQYIMPTMPLISHTVPTTVLFHTIPVLVYHAYYAILQFYAYYAIPYYHFLVTGG